MRLDDTTHVWVVEDEWGDIDTEFFYPETEENTIPNSLVKALWSIADGKAVRLKITPEQPISKGY